MKSIAPTRKLLGLVIVFVLIKCFFITLPAHNDEINHLQGVLVITQHHFLPFVEWWSYHPPLIYEVVAWITAVTQQAPLLIGRSVVAGLGALTLWFIFLLGKKLFNPQVGLWAAVLLFFFPLFQAQSSLFQLAAPLTFFFLATVYFYVSERWWPFMLAAIGLVLTKETGSLILFSLWLGDILMLGLRKPKKTVLLKRAFLINFPQLFFLGWMGLNKQFLGWYLWPFNLSFFSTHKPYATKALTGILQASFWEAGSWVLTLSLVLGLIWVLKNRLVRKLVRKEIIWGFCLLVGFSLFFATGVYLPRYLLFTFPLELIFLAAILDEFASKKRKLLGLIWGGLIIGVLSFHWFYTPNRTLAWAGERNFDYVTIVTHHQRVTDVVLKKYATSRLVSHHPLVAALTKVEVGYLGSNQPLSVTDLEWMPPSQEPIPGIWVISDFYQSAGMKKIWQTVKYDYQVKELEVIKGAGLTTRFYQVEPKTP